MKFAFRRAATATIGVVDPKTERKAILKKLLSSDFIENLKGALILDVLTSLMGLSGHHFKDVLVPQIRASNSSHA